MGGDRQIDVMIEAEERLAERARALDDEVTALTMQLEGLELSARST
jgi:hypothetical protein